MYPQILQFGHFVIPTYGAFIALALIVLLAGLAYFARRLGLDAGKLWNLGVIGILAALVAVRLLVVAEYFGAFLRHPFWVLGLTAIRGWWVDPVAAVTGFAAAMLYALAEGLPLRRVLDCLAPAATLALAIQSAGAFFAGVDFGVPAAHGWAVTYTSGLAALWYHTPLGVRLYPVQLYEAAALLLIFAALAWRVPRRAHDGEICGACLLLAGLAGFLLEFSRAGGERDFWGHEVVCVAMVIVSMAFLVGKRAGDRSYTGVNDPQHI